MPVKEVVVLSNVECVSTGPIMSAPNCLRMLSSLLPCLLSKESWTSLIGVWREACKGALSQFQSSYNELKAVVSKLQGNLEESDKKVQVLEDKGVTSAARMDRMEATVKDIQQNSSSGTKVFEELAERERRATNVIIFDVEESSSKGSKVSERGEGPWWPPPTVPSSKLLG